MEGVSLWGIATIAGPIILLGLFVFVILRNRKAPVSKDVTEDATRANYAAEDRASKNDDV